MIRLYYMAWLDPLRQKEIDHTIERLQLDSGLSYPESSLLEFAKSFGIKVFEADLGDEVKGIIQYHGQTGEKEPVIYLSNSLNESVKNFTLAHEIGHYFLHKQQERFRIDKFDYSSNSDVSRQESEANYFAASLLVPVSQLVDIQKLTSDLDLIAKYFGVSRVVIENRIKWLKMN